MLPTIRKHRTPGNIIHDLFNDDIFSFSPVWDRGFNNSYTPAVNVEETKKGYEIALAAPGLEKKDFKVNVDGNTLTISSTKEMNNENDTDGYIRREFNYSSFSRSFTLPENTDAKKIKASHSNGVLSINIPKENSKIEITKEIKIN